MTRNTTPSSGRPAAPVTPVGAATVLLLRDGAEGLEVFMVVRHREIDFASGALVFPGGKVDPGDQEPALRGAGGDLSAADLAFRVAAIRETFEEAGVLLARPRGGARLIDAERLERIARRHRQPLHDGAIAMRDIVEAEELELACDLLVPFAHWVTPEGQRRRFDTHFFLAAAPEQVAARHDGTESVDSVWIRPAAALADAESGRRIVVFPTRMNLGKLGRDRTVRAALETARGTAIVTVMPTSRKVEGGRLLKIPLEAGYGVSEILVNYGGA
jgi:8-oxo-dGTP pyrophosphatase MutT (NUDIX family)